jgi:hypothetical protein
MDVSPNRTLYVKKIDVTDNSAMREQISIIHEKWEEPPMLGALQWVYPPIIITCGEQVY